MRASSALMSAARRVVYVHYCLLYTSHGITCADMRLRILIARNSDGLPDAWLDCADMRLCIAIAQTHVARLMPFTSAVVRAACRYA